MMEVPVSDEELLRVVVARRGKVRPTEFRLREGEVGLSLFRKAATPDADTIIEAVRAAGKQGELAVAEIPMRVIRELRLQVVAIGGGTPDPAVNALHVEARPPLWRRLLLRVRGKPIHDWFNEHVTPKLAEAARLAQ
jgi:hypothetical protein